jgi:hypothetical protein
MGEWMGVGVQPAEIFDKGDLEKGDAEFARYLYMLDLHKKPADLCPKPSKKCKQFLTNNESKITNTNDMQPVCRLFCRHPHRLYNNCSHSLDGDVYSQELWGRMWLSGINN